MMERRQKKLAAMIPALVTVERNIKDVMDNSMLPQKYLDALRGLDEEQLRELNRHVVERLKLIRKAHQLRELADFNIGDRVYFTHHGRKIVGKIIRLNQKTASIHVEDHTHWNVVPSLLNKFVE